MTKTIRFILNPKAGPRMRYLSTALLEKIFPKKENYIYDYFITTHKGHAQDLAKEAVGLGYNTVVVIGGDGTVNEVVQSLIFTETQLAVIPAGVGNSLSSYYQMPKKMEEALLAVKCGQVIEMDAFVVENSAFGKKYGICSFGYGLGANAAHLFNQKSRNRNMYTFLYFLAKIYFSYKVEPVRLRFNHLDFLIKSKEFIVGNINQYGDGIESIPGAVPNDGLLDMAIFSNISLLRFFRFWLKNMLRDNDSIYDIIEKHKFTELELTFNQPTVIHIDLESHTINGHLNLYVSSNSILFIQPK